MISIQFLESRNNNRAINNLNRESFFSEREEAQAEKKVFSHVIAMEFRSVQIQLFYNLVRAKRTHSNKT